MSLINKYKYKKRQLRYKYNTKVFAIKSWIITNIIGHDDLEEYCIDHDILHDYYNEEPEYDDYRWDRD